MTTYWPPGLGGYLLRHPRDIVVTARAAWRVRARGWWRHRPFLPVPDSAYWTFRTMTANGSYGAMAPEAVVAAARWSTRQKMGR